MTGDGDDAVIANAVVDFKSAAGPAMHLVAVRPKKITVAAIEAMLAPGEKLLSYGDLPKVTFLAFDERLWGMAFIVIVGFSLFFDFVPMILQSAALRQFTHLVPVSFWPLPLVVATLGWLCWRTIRHATYVLTDSRLMRIGSFVWIYQLSSFERAVLHKAESGAVFIELWTKNGEGPKVILELAKESQAITARFPLSVLGADQAAVLPAEPPTTFPLVPPAAKDSA